MSIWLASVITSVFWACMCAVIWISGKHKAKNSQRVLVRAKQETQEISQLPLNSPHPEIQIAEDGQILFANPIALELFPDIKTLGFDHPILKNATGEKSREIEFEKKIYHQNITTTRVEGQNAYIVYGHDITARIAYEQELKAAQKRAEDMREIAEHAKDARGEFLANMSHELRTPMNGIIGLSDILVESDLGGENQNMIEAVNSSARNLLMLLNDILDFSKIEAGELTMEHIPFNIRKTIAQIESLQRPIAEQKGLNFYSDIDEAIPAILIGDPSRLQQILNNLISNALKFTHHGEVVLSLTGNIDPKSAMHFVSQISVRDTGIGIPKNKQAAIFEKFQQADSSTARKYGGTGLGLAITKDLAKLMGGTIAIESEEGVGTTFTVTIRSEIAENQTVTENGGCEELGKASINISAKVMIVDDHPINLLFMRKTLSAIGFQNFNEARSGKEAINLFEKQNYDVIIMDCQMPEMDGFEATQKIREIEDAETAPIIIAATADAMKGAEEKCMRFGMDDYISKPVDKDKLKALLVQWIPGNEHDIAQALEKTNASDAQNPSNEVIDWQRLNAFIDGDKDAEEEILNMFIANIKSDVNALQTALDNKDFKEWDSWMHKIYGACAHLGINALAAICDEGQSLSNTQTDEIPAIHAAFLSEYERVQQVLLEKQ